MQLSIIVPVYNEELTIGEVIDRLLALPIEQQLIVVDDGSTDRTSAVIAARHDPRLVSMRLDSNHGKGYAIREGLHRATGDYILIHDADLELLPEEISHLLAALQVGNAVVVYGSRFAWGRKRATLINYWGNRLLTGWANLLYGSSLTDVSTAFKLFPRQLVKTLDLRCTRFEFCPEITAKLLRLGLKIQEVPVTYIPRRTADGKKLHYLRDGLRAAWTLLRWRFWRPPAVPNPAPCPYTIHHPP
ncbi:MAG: glycosyltransferase family 2 protein [Candidatus Zipacnadales bacterium]